MDLRQLEYFVAVADELNFTRAATRCHVVQSALSYQIGRLEREHGLPLFERTSRLVRLAPAGELLLPRARQLLADLEMARSELAALAGVVTGRLRLGMVGSANQAAPMVERTLADFHRRHPAVEITIQDSGSRQMAEQVRSGVLDAAFVGLFADQVPADLVHRVLAVEPLVAVVGLDDPLAGRGGVDPVGVDPVGVDPVGVDPVGVDPVDLTDVAAGRPFVDMRPESGLRQQVDAAFDRAGVVRAAAFELGTSEAVVRFVGLGFGAAVVPLSATSGRSGVAVLGLTDRLAQHPVSLVHRHPEPSAPSGRAFLALLTAGTLTSPSESSGPH